MAEKQLDQLIRNVRLVRPGIEEVQNCDVGICDGRFVQISSSIAPESARQVYEGKGMLAFPGLVDAHTHVGIYSPLARDAVTESRAAAMGGVTTMLTYFRTGQYYLNRGGSWRDFYPEVLSVSEGNYYVDYAYHMAPIASEHIGEMEYLLTEHGGPSFKIFMFYGGYGLHGKADQNEQRRFLMIGEEDSYDIAHFEFIMREAARLMEKYPEYAKHISVSLHCEMADILNAYTKIVQQDPTLSGLRAYSAARPPHSEGLAIWIASYLAYETACLNINLLHLTSQKALEAAMMMQKLFPHIQFRREVTIGHLLLDYDAPTQCCAKVNPPIRSREDVEFLWEGVFAGHLDWVVSDHACCSQELKTQGDPLDPDNIWVSKSGFGGTEYLLSGMLSESQRRGLPLHRVAELLCRNPAQRYGLLNKGDVAEGYDADLVLVDPDESFVVRAEDSESSQGYTPFEGLELRGKVCTTFLRGVPVYQNGAVVGSPHGLYVRRPTAVPEADS